VIYPDSELPLSEGQGAAALKPSNPEEKFAFLAPLNVVFVTDDGEVVSLTRRPASTPRKIPATHLC
jgi:hypothetical protein